jgi:catechol 2,3-dioxygenase-like lactoylglutathione lyase family enzyme
MSAQPYLSPALDHVQISAPAGCEAAAPSFFGGLLGLRELPKPPALAARGGVWFELAGAQLHAGVEQGHAPAGRAHAALRLAPPELEGLADRLAAAGFRVDWDDALPGYRRFYTDDPWGNRLELLAPIPGR